MMKALIQEMEGLVLDRSVGEGGWCEIGRRMYRDVGRKGVIQPESVATDDQSPTTAGIRIAFLTEN